jgi:hypothetical protein
MSEFTRREFCLAAGAAVLGACTVDNPYFGAKPPPLLPSIDAGTTGGSTTGGSTTGGSTTGGSTCTRWITTALTRAAL